MFTRKTQIIMLSLFSFNVYASCNVVMNTGFVFDINSCNKSNIQSCNVLGNINMLCSSSTPVTLTLSPGNSNQFNPRFLQNEKGDKVYYNIFTDANHTVIFGDGTQNTNTMKANCPANGPCNFNIYAALMSYPIKAGDYTDDVSLLINY